MEKVISEESIIVRDVNGIQHRTTLCMFDTGESSNGRPIIGWSSVAAPGICFATRENCDVHRPNDYTSSKPKTPPEFWRRTPRVKVLPAAQITQAKEERRRVARQIKEIDGPIYDAVDKIKDLSRMERGILSERVWFLTNTKSVPEHVREDLKKVRRELHTARGTLNILTDAKYVLIQEACRLHTLILNLRALERSPKT